MASIISASTTSGTALNMSADTTGVLQLATGATPTTAVTIDASQNVGIGTASPTSQLAVQTTAGSSTGFLKFTDVTHGGDVRFGKNTGISNDAILGTWVANNVRFFASGAEAMRIDSGGNVLVNTTTAVSKLTLKCSSGGFDGGMTFVASTSANYWGLLTDGGTNRFYFGYNGTSKSYIDPSSGSYNALSDSRLKENVIPLSSGLSEVLQLNPVTYNFISDENKANQIGLIAQEVLPVIPEVVGIPTDTEKDNYGLNYAGLTPILVKAIQEQQTIINDLKARVTALEAK